MKLLIVILSVLLGSWNAPPADPPTPVDYPVTYRFHEDSEMTVYGSSNVRDWTMSVPTVNGQLALQPASEGTVPSLSRIQVQVPVKSLTSERGSQTEKAHKALEYNAYPTIYFNAQEIEVMPAAAVDSFQVVAHGELIIAGARRTVDVTVKGTPMENGRYRFRGEHNLLLSDFDIDRPTALLGALRVADEVRLTFNLIAVPEG